MHVQSNSGSLTVQSAVYRWWLNYAQAMAGMNRDPRVGPRLQEFMAAAGLRDVQHQYIRMPIGGWDPSAYHLRSALLQRESTISLLP